MGRGGIPERWEAYTALGKQIVGTRFITFKVPLKPALCSTLPKEDHFTPTCLMEKISNQNLQLGLVIDLTNTNRYYNPQEFLSSGVISYRKIRTEGHVVPSRQVCKRFAESITNFLEQNKDNELLIGVHCTHGINRTGYLLCWYMIQHLDFTPDDAITNFNVARGHDMERVNYLDALRKEPSTETKDESDDEANVSNQSSNDSNRGGRRQDHRRRDFTNGWRGNQHSHYSNHSSWNGAQGHSQYNGYNQRYNGGYGQGHYENDDYGSYGHRYNEYEEYGNYGRRNDQYNYKPRSTPYQRESENQYTNKRQ